MEKLSLIWPIKSTNDLLLKVADFNIIFFTEALKGRKISSSCPLEVEIPSIVKLSNVLDLIRFVIRVAFCEESKLSPLTN